MEKNNHAYICGPLYVIRDKFYYDHLCLEQLTGVSDHDKDYQWTIMVTALDIAKRHQTEISLTC